MLEASETNRAGAVMLCGTLGSGKTMAAAAARLPGRALRGSRVVDIDPRPDHSLERLPGLEDLVHVISLANLDANRGLLDPLVVAPARTARGTRVQLHDGDPAAGQAGVADRDHRRRAR
jgi:hypothetical protein